MSELRFAGVVVSSEPPYGVGVPSSQITYTIRADRPNGDGSTSPVTYQSIAPTDGRWDDGWLCFAAQVGTDVDVVETPYQTRFRFNGAEKPEPSDCGQGGSAAQEGLIVRTLRRLRLIGGQT